MHEAPIEQTRTAGNVPGRRASGRPTAQARGGSERPSAPRPYAHTADPLASLLSRALAHRTKSVAGPAILQRKINILPDAYARGISPNPLVPLRADQLSETQFSEYLAMAFNDEFRYAQAVCTSDSRLKHWNTLHVRALDPQKDMNARVAAVKRLAEEVNRFLARRDANIEDPDAERRYQTNPAKPWSKKQHDGYAHDVSQHAVTWSDDPDMRQKVANFLGPIVSTLPTVNPRGALTKKVEQHTITTRIPLRQLTWPQASQLLPRPLLNLIFDVRYQLETNGATVIDQRTAQQKQDRAPTPNQPGTLRSWHTDSPEVLPGNTFNSQAIPRHAQQLHANYTRDSMGGTGSSQQNAPTAPIGYAEYTGTGSNTEHNTKVVIDYIDKRVYLTVSHYQYWAIITHPGPTYEFFDSSTQELDQAEGRLEKRLGPQDTAVMLSPWFEILMP